MLLNILRQQECLPVSNPFLRELRGTSLYQDCPTVSILVTHNAEEERYLGDKYITLPSNAALPVLNMNCLKAFLWTFTGYAA